MKRLGQDAPMNPINPLGTKEFEMGDIDPRSKVFFISVCDGHLSLVGPIILLGIIRFVGSREHDNFCDSKCSSPPSWFSTPVPNIR
jgi:hypothetical protein